MPIRVTKMRKAIPEPDDAGLPEVSGLAAVETRILHSIVKAISARRLGPGVQLVEEDLAKAFNVSRGRVRKVLLVLSQRGVVRIEPNRGAFVSRPDRRTIAEVFQARRVIEAELARAAARLARPRRTAAVTALRRHLNAEAEAAQKGDRLRQIALSGEFHVRIAEMSENRLLIGMLRDLSLSIAAFPTTDALNCSIAEHGPILDAIAKGDAERAAKLVTHHLEHVEAAIDLPDETLANGGIWEGQSRFGSPRGSA